MDLFSSAKKLLEENRRVTDGHQYTIPSAEHYPYQWLWDSCFHAIVLSHYDGEAAKAEIRALLCKQFDNGMVPHIIYWTPGILHLFRWGVEGTSSLTQPPMIAYAAAEIYQRTSDVVFLKEIYPALIRYYRWMIETRDPRDHHLIGVINPDETGEDNSPRFDIPLKAKTDITHKEHLALRTALVDDNTACNFDAETCMRKFFWVKDVLFNTVLVENLRALERIAKLVGEEEGARYAALHASLIAKAMREQMFEDGVFYTLYGSDLAKVQVETWADFVPLFAGLYSCTEAEELIRTKLLDSEQFWAQWGVRTVSKKEVTYRAGGYGEHFSWRGPVWMAPHWFLYRGLLRYGYTNAAHDLREKSRALIERSGFRECFNPETGEGQGAHGFTWGALLIDMYETDPSTLAEKPLERSIEDPL